MSTYIDTNHIGESGNTNPQSIASWMQKHGFKLAQDTYNKLSSAGFKTIEDFKLMKSSEIVDAATRMNIMLVDQFALKRARDELGNKKNFVDPEELAIINSIDLKIKVFEDQLNNLTSKEKNIQNIRERIEHEIQTTFKMLSKALHDRKAKLLQTITTISQINNDKIKERKNEINQSLGSINKYKTDTANLMDTAIALNELKNRKVKIEANAQQILKIIKETNERNSTNINENVNFVLDATNIVQAISHLGKHVVPILQSLQYDNNDKIKVAWKINDDKQNKYTIRIEHRIHDEDSKENDMNWISKDFEVESNTNEGINDVVVSKTGLYTVRLKYFNGNIWSPFSTSKSVQIDKVVLKWNTNENSHGSSNQIQFLNTNRVKCCWGVAVVDYVMTEADMDVYCFEFKLMENTFKNFDACFGFIQHPHNDCNLNTALYYYKSGHVLYCDNQRKAHVYIKGNKQADVTITNFLKKNDRIGFRINMKNKTAELFYNGSNVGVVFTNIPKAIVPAVSGTGYDGWVTINVASAAFV
eukprot:98552_1